MKLDDFALERYFARWEFRVRHVLCASDCETVALADLVALADDETLARWDGLRLGYTESQGHPLLRAEIARLYDEVGEDDILVFSGAQEAIFAFMNVALEPGDGVVTMRPAYQSLHQVAAGVGARLSFVDLDHDEGWRVDVGALERAADGARAVVVNFPHLPTGAMVGRADFETIVALARDSGARLFSDEVYRFLEVDGRDPLPPAADLDRRAVSLGVMSKAFGLAGLRIGWVATRDRALLERIAAFKDYTTICNSGPSELLALIALRARERLLARNRAICHANLALLDDFFARWEGVYEWVRPRGGSVAFPRVAAGTNADDLAGRLVEEEGVLLLPGSVFGRAAHFRIGFGRADMPEGLARFDAFTARLGGRP